MRDKNPPLAGRSPHAVRAKTSCNHKEHQEHEERETHETEHLSPITYYLTPSGRRQVLIRRSLKATNLIASGVNPTSANPNHAPTLKGQNLLTRMSRRCSPAGSGSCRPSQRRVSAFGLYPTLFNLSLSGIRNAHFIDVIRIIRGREFSRPHSRAGFCPRLSRFSRVSHHLMFRPAPRHIRIEP